jgi:hypothetical protein
MLLSRRRVLAGLACLPLLEAAAPRRVRAQSTGGALRFVGMFHTNGCVPSLWKPQAFGASPTLPLSLQPLQDVLADVSIISNMRLGDTDNMNSHGGGQKCFLTSSLTFDGATSVDQVIGRLTEDQVRLSTLNFSIENNGYYFPPQIVENANGIYEAPNGEDRQDRCQDSESCRVSVVDGTTQANVYHPQVAFERLFGSLAGNTGGTSTGSESGPSPAALKQAARRRRVVDLISGHARTLRGKVSTSDQQRVDEYLEGVRRIERELDQISGTGGGGGSTPVSASCDATTPVSGIPVDRTRYAQLLADIIARGFQCDATRSATYMLGQGVSPMPFLVDGVTYSHHGDASHHGPDVARTNAKGMIDQWQVSVFAYLVRQLGLMLDADGVPIIDRTAIFYTSDIADSDAHNSTDMPLLLGGSLGGALTPGGHIDGGGNTTGNLFVRILQAFDPTISTFGDYGRVRMEGV